jgi:N-acetylglucosamine kinase-like BadF-type ATPase
MLFVRQNEVMPRTSTRETRSPGWCVGVDLGGTWIRAVAVDSRGRRRQAKQTSPGLDGLHDFSSRLWRRWAFRRGDVRSLVVASRGVWTDAERRRLTRRLRDLARHVTVISDVEAAYLGALGDRSGILLLAGTGSMALGGNGRGGWARAGGWGPLLGDEGSAFWIGREWLRTTMGTTGFGRARRILRSPDPVARIASLAPSVLRGARHGPGTERQIITRSQEALASLIVEISRELRLDAPVLVSWSGGLLADRRFRAGVWGAARRRGVVLNPATPRRSAVAAAMLLAEREARR